MKNKNGAFAPFFFICVELNPRFGLDISLQQKNQLSGAQFPGAATGAYSIINAEFPNGVVQSNSGAMSSGDQQLYDNNYQRIKNLFATVQLGGFFIV